MNSKKIIDLLFKNNFFLTIMVGIIFLTISTLMGVLLFSLISFLFISAIIDGFANWNPLKKINT